MWMYPGPSCLNHPFSVELGDTEINTRIRRILAHGADQNFGSGPIPLIREGVKSPCMGSLEFSFVSLCQFLLLNSCAFLRRILGTHAVPHGGHLTWGCDEVGGLPPHSLISSCVVFLQLLYRGSTDVPALLVELT
jgi:hypothetical protein